MFKPGRWRTDKNKVIVKAVFKLQFHATQVPLSVGDGLMLSVVPGNVGKPSVKLEKAVVKEGNCSWDKPVFETVKLVRDPKTGKICERIYHFLVSNGSQKSSVSGEVLVDFADYAEATKPCSLSLPLKSLLSGAILHVSIQRMQERVDQRESEDMKNKANDKSLKTFLSNGDINGNTESNTIEDAPLIRATSYNPELNGNHRGSCGSDTMSGSECSFELDTPRELSLRNKNINQEPSSFVSSVSHKSTSNDSSIHQDHQKSQWEWSLGSDGLSTDDSSNNSQDTLRRESSLKCSDIESEKLKIELAILARQAEVSELELQTLRKQIVKENKRGQDFLREVASLKEERDAMKAECDGLKALQKVIDDGQLRNKVQSEEGDPWVLLEELRQQLHYEKDLNTNLRVQLQKTRESNCELILAVQDLDDTVEQRNREISNLSNDFSSSENARVIREPSSNCEIDEDEEQKALEKIVKDHNDGKEAYVLHQKIIDLHNEIEIYKRDNDDLEMQMEQLALDYEILKQENHEISYRLEQSQVQEQLKMQYECSGSLYTIHELEAQIENLENELKKQGKDYAESLATITELENYIKNMEEEQEKQAQGFEADLESLISTKVEQEQRAIRAEETLRVTKLKNVKTAEMLQEEFRRLSMQMASTFDANEKMTIKAMAEASELRLQNNHLEEMLQKTNKELLSVRGDYAAKLHDLSLQINVYTHQIENMLSEVEDKTKKFEFQKEHEKEMHRNLSQEIVILRSEIERLNTENNVLAEQRNNSRVELEQMKTSTENTELLLLRMSMERNELEDTVVLMRKEAESSLEELKITRSLKQEKETTVENLQSELKTLKSQYNELQQSLLEDESENEKLQKLVIELTSDLKKKEIVLNNTEKELKNSNGQSTLSVKAVPRNHETSLQAPGSEEAANPRESIKMLEVAEDAKVITLNGVMPEEVREINQDSSVTTCKHKQNGIDRSFTKSDEAKTFVTNARDQSNLDEVKIEMAELKEKNKSMEAELKEMQERYSEISLKFAEVEGERQRLVMSLRSFKKPKKRA